MNTRNILLIVLGLAIIQDQSLVASKETKDNTEDRKETEPLPKKVVDAAAKLGGLDMADLMANLMKEGNAAQLMQMMRGEEAMAGMDEILPQLMEGGNVKKLLVTVQGFLKSSPYGDLLQKYGAILEKYAKQAMASPAWPAYLATAKRAIDAFIKTDNGKRFLELIYALMTAKDVDEGLSLLRKVVEIKGGEFFTKIQKSDPHVFWRELKSWGAYLGKVFVTVVPHKDSALEAAADYMVQGYNLVINQPKDSTLSKVPAVMNELLASQGLPAIDMKNPVDSLTKIANKVIKLFTTWKLDLTPHVKEAREVYEKIYEKHAKGNKFEKLSGKEKKALLVRILAEVFVNPTTVETQYNDHVEL